MKRFAPATERNREPILAVLRRFVVPGAKVLEIASGSGEHAVYLAPRLSVLTWQPSDMDPEARASIDAWREGIREILPPIELDVTKPWPPLRCDLVMCANMIHIAPWAATVGLLDGAENALGSGRHLYLYGPFKRGGRHTAASNEAFDQSLRARNPEWGVRDLETVIDAASDFTVTDVIEMPANNLSVILTKR